LVAIHPNTQQENGSRAIRIGTCSWLVTPMGYGVLYLHRRLATTCCRYMRNPPFSYDDKHPLRSVQRGGGECETDSDCGGDIIGSEPSSSSTQRETAHATNISNARGRGRCVEHVAKGVFSTAPPPTSAPAMVCSCHAGFTGPHCLVLHHVDEAPSAYILRSGVSPFERMHTFAMPGSLLGTIVTLMTMLSVLLFVRVREQTKERKPLQYAENGQKSRTPYSDQVIVPSSEISTITRSSV
jgi:hypothetical protein